MLSLIIEQGYEPTLFKEDEINPETAFMHLTRGSPTEIDFCRFSTFEIGQKHGIFVVWMQFWHTPTRLSNDWDRLVSDLGV